MAYLGSFGIDDYVGIPAATHRFSSGAAYVPTSLTYSIYEEATTTGLDEDVDMTPASPFDSVVGCYWIRRQLTTAAGFEAGKNYLVLVKATVDSVAAIQMHTFQIGANVNVSAAALAAINAEVDTALNTAIPGSPTADSINERVKAVDDKLPSKSYLTGSDNSDGDIELDEATGDITSTVKASVNAEVVDALATDTYAELALVPAANASLADKIRWLFLLAKNKITQTATTQTVLDDAKTGTVATAAVSDDGTTFTRDEFESPS